MLWNASNQSAWQLTIIGVAAAWLLSGNGGANANDGAIVGIGGALKPMKKHPSVRLVSEAVVARISEQESAEGPELFADVECIFLLDNTGEAVEAEMGFPEFGYGAWTSYGRMKGTTGFVSFESQVDGQPWPTKVVDSQVSPNETLQRWRVKTVPFSAHQRRTVRDCYRMRLGEANWSANGPLRPFSYVLDTGTSWQGTIGEARVTLDFSRVRSYEIMEATPLAGQKVPERRRLIWQWHNFEPTAEDNIRVTFIPESYSVMLHGARYGGTSLSEDSFVGLYADQVQRRNGEIMVPVNALAECLGRWSQWNPKVKTVSFGGSRGETRRDPGWSARCHNRSRPLLVTSCTLHHQGASSLPF